MAIKSRAFAKGIRLKGSTDASTLEGELRLDPSALKFKAYVDGAERSIVTEDQSQTITNKTIDADNNTISNIETDNLKAGVLITDISTATSDTELPSALAVKTALEGQNEASEITYDNSTSGLTATDVQAAIDEVEGRVDTVETDLGTVTTGLSDHLADAVDAHDASAISNIPAGNLAATDVQGALDELQSDVDTRALANLGTITNASIQTPSRLDTKQDTEANLITYAGSASDGQFVFATDTKKMYQIIDNELAAVGGGGATAFEINQVAHGFAVGEGVYHNGATWVKAQANDADTLAYFVIVEVIDVDNFIAADFGRIEVPAHGYTIGNFYFLSDSVAGQATNVEPSSFSNPLFYVEDANTLQVKCLRPAVVGQDVTLDLLSDVSVPSPTNGQALIFNNGSGLWEAADVAGTAADITYDNSTSGLVATDSQAAIDEVESRVDTLESATTALDDLSDVSVATPNDGEVLTYNSTSGDWESKKAASSQVNYIENNDFEVDTSGWTGDTNLVISRITSGQLRGTGSLKIAKAAADASGEQVYTDFSVDTADLAKKLTISFDYDTSDANYSDGDMRILIIKDPAGTPVTIRVNGEDLKGGKNTHIAQFQTDATITDYRLVIEQVSTNAAAVDLYFDNIQVGPREVVKGAAMTDWKEFTPIVAGGGSATWSLLEGRYRRVGDSVEYSVTANASVAGSGGSVLQFELPENLQADTTKIKGSSGYGREYNLGSVTNTWAVFDCTYSGSGNGGIIFQNVGTSGAYVGSSVTSSSQIYFNASLPIIGWSSNAISSEDFSGRDVELHAAGNSGQVILANTTNIPFDSSVIQDTTSSWNGSIFECPETGYYDVDFKIRITSANQPQIRPYIDGSSIGSRSFIESTSTSFHNGNFLGLYLEKGQELSLRSSDGFTLQPGDALHNITISKRSSPQTVLETETVAARYTSNAGTNISPSTYQILKYEDIDFDTHSMYDISTGILTIPTTGKYNISSKAMLSGLNADQGEMSLAIYINGTKIDEDYNYIGRGSLESRQVVTTLDLIKGDEVTIRLYQTNGAGRVQFNQNSYNTFSIARIK